MELTTDVGHTMYEFLGRLFPICRSLTGEGVRQTLRMISEHLPLKIHEVPSGTQVFDWTVPQEWLIRDAYLLDENGRKVVDFKQNNLHVVGYSAPIDEWLEFDTLQDHLHSREDFPDAIPYVTSYYKRRWGFCLSHSQRAILKPGRYRAVIDSELFDGFLTYGELLLPGELKDEIFFSTYVCHPSMANNELSGPTVVTFLAKWLMLAPRRYTYRIVFAPETIGALSYLSRNLPVLKRRVIAGFNMTCMGDDRGYSFLPSRQGNTLADRAALTVLKHRHPEFKRYTYLDRGSDERQYCSPGVNLPMVSIMRSKYGTYREYHTSLDDMNFVSPAGLRGSFEVIRDCVELLEQNSVYELTCLGEPQLSKRNLYPDLGTSTSGWSSRDLMNFVAFADGTNDLIRISEITNLPPWQIYPIVKTLKEHKLLRQVC